MVYTLNQNLRAGGGPDPPQDRYEDGEATPRYARTNKPRKPSKAPVGLLQCMGSLQKVQQHYFVWDATSNASNDTTLADVERNSIASAHHGLDTVPVIQDAHECHQTYAHHCQYVATPDCCASHATRAPSHVAPIDMPVRGKHQGSPSVDGSKPRWSPCHEWVHQISQGPVYSSAQIRYNTLPQQLIPHGLCSTPSVPPPQYDHIRPAMDPNRVIPGAQGDLFPPIHSHGRCPGHSHEPDTSPPVRWPAGNALGDIGAPTTAWQTSGAQLGHRQENFTDNNGAAHDVPLSIGCKSTGLCSSDAYAPLGTSHEQLLAIAPHMWGYSMAAEHGWGNLGLSGEAYLASAQECGYPRQGFQPAATTAYQDYQAFSAGTEGTTPTTKTVIVLNPPAVVIVTYCLCRWTKSEFKNQKQVIYVPCPLHPANACQESSGVDTAACLGMPYVPPSLPSTVATIWPGWNYFERT
ncbi:hypothetical protein C2E23DRAFT_859657 [Lenzites betulinus]|nr:hypothetical protein C2E23DRAFT_859657 [Lenzites betulinus]